MLMHHWFPIFCVSGNLQKREEIPGHLTFPRKFYRLLVIILFVIPTGAGSNQVFRVLVIYFNIYHCKIFRTNNHGPLVRLMIICKSDTIYLFSQRKNNLT